MHTDGDAPNWTQIVAVYDQLVRLARSPIVRLNRAIAVAECDGPDLGLALVEALEPELRGYHPFHAARAEVLRRLGRDVEARGACGAAIELAGNAAELAYLRRRRHELVSAGPTVGRRHPRLGNGAPCRDGREGRS